MTSLKARLLGRTETLEEFVEECNRRGIRGARVFGYEKGHTGLDGSETNRVYVGVVSSDKKVRYSSEVMPYYFIPEHENPFSNTLPTMRACYSPSLDIVRKQKEEAVSKMQKSLENKGLQVMAAS